MCKRTANKPSKVKTLKIFPDTDRPNCGVGWGWVGLKNKLCMQVKILPNCRYKGTPGQNANNTFSFEVFSRDLAAPEPPKDPSKPKIQVVGEMPAKPKVCNQISRRSTSN
jgi:hypothetical protein